MTVLYNGSCEEGVVSNIESVLGIDFPRCYFDFLLRHNGLKITNGDYVDIPLEKVDNGFISFYCLYGCAMENENLDLLCINNEVLDDLVSVDRKIVIGEDGGGNFYVLTADEGGDKIYYWDRTHLHSGVNYSEDISEVDECGGLYLVAKSFDDFYLSIINNVKSN
ncbi:SMI1/KNR4 family protein [Chitinibacter fontanus]|uniref:SMI1/KNR4 family protein n=1 Tax=Chitinibacter fontanus TaxID=1737446 RepID=A0A7D5Z2U6_9NEIS|nr:SMI1/KNR4 family protein [Chitinibacter fontanus]QLI81281.1 SMI1/KNR4 family protein [Chitinibacter fontanus]